MFSKNRVVVEQYQFQYYQYKFCDFNYKSLNIEMEMIQVESSIIEKINQLYGKRLINIDLLQQYKNKSGNSLIKDLKALMQIKKPQKKEELVRIICQNLQDLTIYQTKLIKNYLSSIKKTSIGKITTLLLIPQAQIRQEIEQTRKKLIISIRKNNPISPQHQQLFQTLYYTLYSVKKRQQHFQHHQTQKNIKHFKSLLVSLKRMMNTNLKIKKANIFKPKRESPYPLNLDVKSILQKVRDKLQQSQTGILLQNILNKTKHKKWLGIRLYKLLQKECWSIQNIKNLIDGLKSVKLTSKQFRTKFHIIRKTIRKIIVHLQRYINNLIKESHFKDQNEQSQQMDDDDDDNERQYLQRLQIQDIGDFLVKEKSIERQDDPIVSKQNKNYKNLF